MVMETTDLHWTLETIAHEWIHNYLTLRPLGINYSTTPELRTMNETTASIAGNEIGTYVLQNYYPELMTASDFNLISLNRSVRPSGGLLTAPSTFVLSRDLTADKPLAEGKIKEAKRTWNNAALFWQMDIAATEPGYFAFHGAYADVPGGAAGEDPVGPAVRALREQSASLEDFLNTIAWMTSFEQLQQAIKK
jgi:hypothetical protein